VTRELEADLSVAGVDRPLSRLALGTAFFSLQRRDICFDLLDRFVEVGGTAIDTARGYGESEAVIGAWLEQRGLRNDVVLITKCAHGDDLLPADDFERVVTDELAASLTALRTECIDLYMLHRDNPSVPVARIVDRLNGTVALGRVRALGASNWTYDRIDAANEYADKHGLAGFAVVSNHLSLAKARRPFYPNLVTVSRAAERWHRCTGVPLLAWSAQARGFFAGWYTPQLAARADELDDEFARRMIDVYATDANFERLRRASALGQEKGGFSAVQIALAWLLHKPFPVVPIVGPHTTDELASSVAAVRLDLTKDEVAWVNVEDWVS
jgi:aryl-alcohol dehydrogenase-like predicted oxidoreductase